MSDINIKGEDRFGLTISEVSVQGWLAPFFSRLWCGTASWLEAHGRCRCHLRAARKQRERETKERGARGRGWRELGQDSALQ
jgi:hypothetical protein